MSDTLNLLNHEVRVAHSTATHVAARLYQRGVKDSPLDTTDSIFATDEELIDFLQWAKGRSFIRTSDTTLTWSKGEGDQTLERITITCETEEELRAIEQVLVRQKAQRISEDEMRKQLQPCIAY